MKRLLAILASLCCGLLLAQSTYLEFSGVEAIDFSTYGFNSIASLLGTIYWEAETDGEVEYLQSTGSGTYILLPLIWNDTMHVEVTWQRTSTATMNIFGCRTANGAAYYAQFFHERNNDTLSNWHWRNYTAQASGAYWCGAENQQRVETAIIDFPTLMITGSSGAKTVPAYVPWYPNTAITLFGIGNAAKTALHTSSPGLRIYSFKASDSSGPLYDLVPWVKDGEGCMYDRVSDTFIYNAGTGIFIVGPKKR